MKLIDVDDWKYSGWAIFLSSNKEEAKLKFQQILDNQSLRREVCYCNTAVGIKENCECHCHIIELENKRLKKIEEKIVKRAQQIRYELDHISCVGERSMFLQYVFRELVEIIGYEKLSELLAAAEEKEDD